MHWQTSGRFLCQNVYLQFGDVYAPEWAHYSGEFHSQGNKLADRKDSRTYYVDESKTRQLAYCRAEEAWTVSHLSSGPCEYIFKSSKSSTFDVMEVTDGIWSVKTESAGDVPVDWLKLTCNDCNEQRCKAENGRCSKTENKCVCHSADRIGLNCELQPKCDYYNVDSRTTESLASVPGSSLFLKNGFTSLPNITMYQRNIYVPLDGPIGYIAQSIDSFILFTGLRWVIYSLDPSQPVDTTTNDFVAFLSENDPSNNPVQTLKNITDFWKGKFSPVFFSTPVGYGASFSAEPSGVSWVLARETNSTLLPYSANDDQKIPAELLCSDCVS